VRSAAVGQVLGSGFLLWGDAIGGPPAPSSNALSSFALFPCTSFHHFSLLLSLCFLFSSLSFVSPSFLSFLFISFPFFDWSFWGSVWPVALWSWGTGLWCCPPGYLSRLRVCLCPCVVCLCLFF